MDAGHDKSATTASDAADSWPVNLSGITGDTPAMNPTGSTTVSSMHTPDVADFDAFYALHHRRAVGLAYALCGDRAAAEELAHDAFTEAFRTWRRVGTFQDPGAWLRQVIANRSVSRWRRLGRESAALRRLNGRAAPTMGEVGESTDAFWELVRRLPARQAQAVALHYADDRPLADIATILGCTENTVKAHLFKARRTLAAQLGVTDDEETR